MKKGKKETGCPGRCPATVLAIFVNVFKGVEKISMGSGS